MAKLTRFEVRARQFGKTMARLNAAPLGTRALAHDGGAWCKVERGWKWNGPDGNGGTFPQPGGDWNGQLVIPVSLTDGGQS